MTSRTASPLTVRSSSPGRIPACSAGEPVATATTRAHPEARVRAGKGYTILYVGHDGHDEAVGTLAVAPEAIRLVEHDEDLDGALESVTDASKVALLAQTTLALEDWQGITERARE